MQKKKVAVFFGGRSPEHDVSIVSGLQVLHALNRDLYDPFPVYVTTDGLFFVGEPLKDQKNYFLKANDLGKLTAVTLDTSLNQGGVLWPKQSSIFRKKPPFTFDIALPIFHGRHGEDGCLQGLFEFANIAYAGMRSKACAVFMDKDSTKKALSSLPIQQLPYVSIPRPSQGLLIEKNQLEARLKGKIDFPCCIKPANLGSSIGVGKADTIDQARTLLANIFKHDNKAIIEPFIVNRVEYNIAVRCSATGQIETSAIERPKSSQELLDFKEKYLSSKDNKISGPKTSGTISQGMLSLTREINPEIPKELENQIRQWAIEVFSCFDAAGAPRIDFMFDATKNQLWFNELNPIPGSYGYFLWEASDHHVLFTDLLTELIQEAEEIHSKNQLPKDPVPEEARLFAR